MTFGDLRPGDHFRFNEKNGGAWRKMRGTALAMPDLKPGGKAQSATHSAVIHVSMDCPVLKVGVPT